MKKTINVNLGGQAFIIDESAYEILHTYFEKLRTKFSNETERKEIMEDIENRVAEVFQKRMGNSKAVITEQDVVYVIGVLGRPEDIAGDNAEGVAGEPAPSTNAAFFNSPREKKFFRDDEDKRVGGVIAGLCHYFGWGDPTWVRIGIVAICVLSHFLHLHLTFPIAVVYFILLIVVPKARTATEKLQMRGEPVTIKNIEKEVRDAMHTTSQSVNSVFRDGTVQGHARTVLTLFAKIVLIFVLLICLVFLVALISGFFGLTILSSASLGELTQLFVSRQVIMWWNVGLFLTLGIPLISIMYGCVRYLTGQRRKNVYVSRAFGLLWVAGFLTVLFISAGVWRDFSVKATSSQPLNIMQPAGHTMLVQLSDTFDNEYDSDKDDEPAAVFISGIGRTDYGFALGRPHLELAVSPDSLFHLEKIMTSRGNNGLEAKKNMGLVRYKFTQTDSLLNLDSRYEIGKNGKWRNQKIRLRLLIPEGKNVLFSRNIDELEATVRGDKTFNEVLFANRNFTVTGGHVVCKECGNDREKSGKDKDDGDEF